MILERNIACGGNFTFYEEMTWDFLKLWPETLEISWDFICKYPDNPDSLCPEIMEDIFQFRDFGKLSFRYPLDSDPMLMSEVGQYYNEKTC